MNDIEQKQKQRFQFLQLVYEKSDGDESRQINSQEIGLELGFDVETTTTIMQYLSGEGLIRILVRHGPIKITHDGVVEIENALANPQSPTTYFPPAIHLSGDFRGAILNLGSIMENVNQSISIMPDMNDDIKDKLQILVGQLSDILKQVPQEYAADAEAVAWATELMLDTVGDEKKNQTKIEITKEGLLKAAGNIVAVMPMVLKISKDIIAVLGV